jgi:AcrR family transcriptional regulator
MVQYGLRCSRIDFRRRCRYRNTPKIYRVVSAHKTAAGVRKEAMNKTEAKTDRRILNSKNRLKNALMELLSGKSMDGISVTQICRAANITRITFYTYYRDKYDLAEEMFHDMAAAADSRFSELQKDSNPDGLVEQSYCNLLTSILELFYENDSLLPFALYRENPNLYRTFSRYLQENVAGLAESEHMHLRFSAQMLGSFLCDGLWGFICEGRKENIPVETIRKEANELIRATVKTAGR